MGRPFLFSFNVVFFSAVKRFISGILYIHLKNTDKTLLLFVNTNNEFAVKLATIPLYFLVAPWYDE